MTGWDILDKFINSFPPIATALTLLAVLAAVVILIVGFSKHGFNFLKYGFKQMILDSSLEKRFDDLGARIDGIHTELGARIDGIHTELGARIDGIHTELGARIDGVHTELGAIKSNHFGHLKDFLAELTSILLDKGIINNTDKARLDSRLRGM